jgi:hypothetical protein
MRNSGVLHYWIMNWKDAEGSSWGFNWNTTLKRTSARVTVRVNLWLAVYHQSVRLGAKPVWYPGSMFFFFQLNTCGYNPHVTSFLTRRWVCRFNCCWPSPMQSFSGPSPAGLITIFYSLRFQTTSSWRVRSPYLYPPGTGWPIYNPKQWVPFSMPLTTSRATVEIHTGWRSNRVTGNRFENQRTPEYDAGLLLLQRVPSTHSLPALVGRGEFLRGFALC